MTTTTDQILYQAVTLLQNSTFYRILGGFNKTFATDMACRRGTPQDTWSRRMWDLYMFYLLSSC